MKRIAIFLSCFCLCVFIATAQHSASTLNSTQPSGLTLSENLATPIVPSKSSNAIIRHMEKIAAAFNKHGLKTTSLRKGEVIKVSVPCDDLFLPNDTVLLPSAYKILNAFNAIVRLPHSYKMLIVVNSDNTGSEKYLDALTESRANAIEDYFYDNILSNDLNIVPYWLGDEEPVAPNNSIAGRAANRRADFYIIPETQTLQMARSGKL